MNFVESDSTNRTVSIKMDKNEYFCPFGAVEITERR